MINFRDLSPSLRDGIFFAAWMVLILLIAGLCWFLSSSVRNEFLINAVNRAGFYSRERVFLDKPVPSRELSANAGRMGSWFYIRGNAGGKALVFTLFAQGSFLPCMALVDSQGKTEEILPLSVHSQTMLNRMPAGVLNIYMRRIEEALR